MAARIEWNAGVPELARQVVEPLLARFHGLIPTWCDVRVLWGEENGEFPAMMYVHGEYRNAQLVLYPGILDCDAALREEYIVHELEHIPLMEMKKTFHDLLEALDLEREQPALYRWAVEGMRQANEGATTDLTEGLRRMGVFG